MTNSRAGANKVSKKNKYEIKRKIIYLKTETKTNNPRARAATEMKTN